MSHCNGRRRVDPGFAIAAIVAVAGFAAFRFAQGPNAVRASDGCSQPESFPLLGVARDFRAGHPDFTAGIADALGYSAGNVTTNLSADGLPMYSGSGKIVTTPAHDSAGRAIAPGVVRAQPVTTFSISSREVASSQPFAAKVTVIGSAISAGGAYDIPVTMKVKVGSAIHQPFGAFGGAISGNVNDGHNPRSFVLPALVQPGTSITVEGQSWNRRSGRTTWNTDADWAPLMDVNSSNTTVNLRVLRNGDSVPNVAGFQGQVSAKAMLTAYIDAATNKMKLGANQVIFLFELGTSNSNSSAFDLQDLAVLLEMATDPSYFTLNPPPPPNNPLPCNMGFDTAAVLGASNTGGITSAQSFAQWFTDVAGQNLSVRRVITLTKDGSGMFVYSVPDFHPINGELYGNGGGDNNRGFTYAFEATCTYSQCAGQILEYSGDGDAWMFVNGQLAMDMGGGHRGASQLVSLDRFGLSDGAPVTIKFFYAQRSTNDAAFTLKTNIRLRSAADTASVPPVSGLYD